MIRPPGRVPWPSRRFSARFITLAIGLWLFTNPLAAQHLAIRFFNVGQGDAALIREGGKTALIDAGGGAQVVMYLRELRIDIVQ